MSRIKNWRKWFGGEGEQVWEHNWTGKRLIIDEIRCEGVWVIELFEPGLMVLVCEAKLGEYPTKDEAMKFAVPWMKGHPDIDLEDIRCEIQEMHHYDVNFEVLEAAVA